MQKPKKRISQKTMFSVFFALLCIIIYSFADSGKINIAKSFEISETNTSDEGILKVHYLDVGQADSTFVELPNGETLLIDAGNPENAVDVTSAIRNLKYSKIDYIVCTHPHDDHIGGMAEVIKSFDVGKLYMPDAEHTTRSFENLLDVISEKNLKINRAKAGVSIINSKNLRIDILSPVKENYSDINNFSAVVKIKYKEKAFIFTGDAESSVERELIRSGADLSADVLKAGHHGSSTASCEEFVKKVAPVCAVISCGKGNSYGHPNAEVLQILKKYNVDVYRTDLNGTVLISTDGKNIIFPKKSSVKKENAPPEEKSSNDGAESLGEKVHPSYVTPGANEDLQPADKEASAEIVSQTAGDEIVYITNTGKKYHRNGCRYLSKSKIQSNLSIAKSKGLTPCSICTPPN